MTEKDKYRKTEGVLYNYKKIKAEIKNLELEIKEVEREYRGCGAITYEEKTGPTNKFSSSVENELELKIKVIDRLVREMEKKQTLIQKIDNALEILDDRSHQIIKLRYFEKIPNKKVAIQLDLTEQRISELKSTVINDIADLIFLNKFK